MYQEYWHYAREYCIVHTTIRYEEVWYGTGILCKM